MAHEEYASDDDDEDTSGEGMATATVAIATSSPTKVSFFGAPNENLIAKCLMDKGINKVTPTSKPLSLLLLCWIVWMIVRW